MSPRRCAIRNRAVSYTHLLAINATGNPELDKAKLEGLNSILKKYIREILLHFNLPFEKESLEPSRKEIIRVAGELSLIHI